jgi:hypothetical protein
MKAKLLFGAGLAAGFVLGSRSGRAAYEKIKARAAGIWDSKPVQDKVAAASEAVSAAVREKAPEVSDQLTEAARRAGTVISSAMHRDTHKDTGTTAGIAGTGAEMPAGDYVPSHSAHPETIDLGQSDVSSDPALNDKTGQDWSDEGGATPSGAATNTDPDRTAG